MPTNRLIKSQSPYLLQHAENPVDWYPWGEEALNRAKAENKPIIVSIGYSACHWCHVMEHESFEDEATARLMNENFICVKIDREERPDLDNIYMDAVQTMGLNGGWPLNVFLMPNQKPFYGGTYFPNDKWKGLLSNIADAFAKHEDQLAESAEQFASAIGRKEIEKYGITSNDAELDADELTEIYFKLSAQFDEEWGGMSRIPKFPMPSIWNFVLNYGLLSRSSEVQDKAFFTLTKIAWGGIYDHLRGGFARYSVDGEWFAPHFEKMLYDNGQLLELYAKAYQVSKNPLFKEKVLETIAWLSNEMLQEDGGFHSAQDADSEGEEGKFYTWKMDEINAILQEDTNLVSKLYNLKAQGNWEAGVNILFQTESYTDVSAELGMDEDEFTLKLAQQKAQLLKVRNNRIYPGKDDKVLSGWNAWMSIGLIRAYHATGEKKALELAERNLTFIKEKMTEDGQLYRSFKNGQRYTPAFLEDYATLIKANIDLYQALGKNSWILDAQELMDFCMNQFFDESDGYFFFNNPKSEKLIANKKELFDNVIPASNSIMAENLHRLGLLAYRDDWSKRSLSMLQGIKDLIVKEPGFLTNWANLYLSNLVPSAEIVIIGKGAQKLASEILGSDQMNFVIAWSETVTNELIIFDHKVPDQDGNALIYVCFDRACQRPVKTASEALELLPYLG
ncbi:thioredoxin domain-containing protein [Algoriphagus sediminis]|uniref:Thioredoxin domain-containing protein n=1 Tax=Algoriphagus sediminis TaxID=3057113 RepID=A0ABT7Y9U9_9BACT|nr:thioredoxin domain-containing protein [Algoriphagus sediminis]MDN3203231.1 thioredoxin domain-containing protein [Algoriphagus sediminis]